MLNEIEKYANRSSNSGAKIIVENGGNGTLIKKKIYSATQRDYSSLNKQIRFKQTQFLSSVDILEVNNNNIELTITMPYEKGLISEKYAERCGFDDVCFIADALNDYFRGLIQESIEFELNDIVLKKIKDIISSLGSKFGTPLYDICISKAKKIEGELNSMPIYYPHSKCHGDMTLSNLIYRKNDKRIYMIDFLEVYIDSYLSDYVKLLQDLKYGWSVRFKKEEYKFKHHIMGAAILGRLNVNDSGYDKAVAILNTINLIRIAPYIKDNITEQWLTNILKRSEI